MRLKPVDGGALLENSNAVHNNIHGPVSQYTSSDGNRNTTEPNGITTTTTATTITTTTTTGDNKPTRPDHQANKQLQFDDAYSQRTQWVSGWPAYQKPTQLVTNINYRQPQPQQPQPEPQLYSPVDSLADYEEGQDSCSSSEDFTPDGDCSDSDFEERSSSLPARGIVNPNYPGFQHLAHQLHSPQQDTFNNNNNNNDEEEEDLNHLGESEEEEYTKEIDAFNRLDSDPAPAKPAYSRPKLNIPLEPTDNRAALEVKEVNKLACLPEAESPARHQPPGAKKAEESEEEEEERGRLEAAQPTKREKTEMNLTVQKGAPANIHYHLPPANMISNNNNNNNNQYNRTQHTGGFDVYNIETAMPKIDLEAIETHLRAAREEERRRRNDREEIRRRLATGSDADDYYGGDRPGRKPSLQARLQSGMNLQICFMNETMSDSESPCTEAPPSSNVANTTPTLAQLPPAKPKTIIQDPVTQTTVITAKKNSQLLNCSRDWQMDGTGGSFFERQARLQAEARVALAQAKELARMQMQTERQRQQTSPITSMLRASLNKVGIAFPDGRRRVSRQMLTDMNVAQLQVIVNDLHTQIEQLNEGLVKYLMERDELHMSQDSMLVDIEDLTRYLGAKENMIKEETTQNNNIAPSAQTKPMISRIVSLGKK